MLAQKWQFSFPPTDNILKLFYTNDANLFINAHSLLFIKWASIPSEEVFKCGLLLLFVVSE